MLSNFFGISEFLFSHIVFYFGYSSLITPKLFWIIWLVGYLVFNKPLVILFYNVPDGILLLNFFWFSFRLQVVKIHTGFLLYG